MPAPKRRDPTHVVAYMGGAWKLSHRNYIRWLAKGRTSGLVADPGAFGAYIGACTIVRDMSGDEWSAECEVALTQALTASAT